MARSAAGRINRGGVSYDQRTGLKVKGRQLRPDGENPNLWTTDPDELNPQRFVRPFSGVDGNRNWKVGSPSLDAIGATVNPMIAFGHNSLIPYAFPQLSIGAPPPTCVVEAGTGVMAIMPDSIAVTMGSGTWEALGVAGGYGVGAYGSGPYNEGTDSTQSGTW